MTQVSVTIDGKTFRLACDDGQEDYLRSLAEHFDQSLQTMKNGFGEIGEQRLIVMAGMMVTDRLFETEKKVRALEAELESLRNTRTVLVDHGEVKERQTAEAISKAAQQISQIADKLAAGKVASAAE